MEIKGFSQCIAACEFFVCKLVLLLLVAATLRLLVAATLRLLVAATLRLIVCCNLAACAFFIFILDFSLLSCVHMTKICVYANFAYMQILHT